MGIKTFLILNIFCLLILHFKTLVAKDVLSGFCANEKCSEPVAEGTVIINYNSPDDSRISVSIGEKVQIFVTNYGPKKDLLGIMVRGTRGYISQVFIRETKKLAKRTVPATVEFKTQLPVSEFVSMSNNVHESSHPIESDSFINDASSESPYYSEASSNSIQQKHVNPSENLQQSSYLNPSTEYDTYFDESSQMYDDPMLSGYALHSGDVSSSPNMPGMESGSILPSPTRAPDIKHSPLYQSHLHDDTFPGESSFYEDSLNIKSDFGHGKTKDSSGIEFSSSSSVVSSQDFQSISNEQQQLAPDLVFKSKDFSSTGEFSSEYSHHIKSSEIPLSEYDDEELSKTFAMLSNRGFDDKGNSYIESESQFSNQNEKSDFGDFNGISSQLHESHIASSSVIHSSVNPSQSVKESKVLNSNILKDLKINQPPLNIKVEESTAENLIDNGDLKEVEDDNGTNDGSLESEEKNLNSPGNVHPSAISKDDKSMESQFNIHSSMSLGQSGDPSKLHQNIQSSVENSIIDPSVDNEPVVSDTNSNPPEETVVLHSTVQSIDIENTNAIEPNIQLNSSENDANEISSTDSDGITEHVTDKDSKHSNKKIDDVNDSKDTISEVEADRNNSDSLSVGTEAYDQEHTTPAINSFFVESERNSNLDKIESPVDIDGIEDLSTYQNRNLKSEFSVTEEQPSDSDPSGHDDGYIQSDPKSQGSSKNWLSALQSFVDSVMAWIPDPLYSALMDLKNKGLSPRVPVFTALCGFGCIFLIIPLVCIKEWSKESKLTAQLASVEKDVYTFSAENIALRDKLDSVTSELSKLQASLSEEKSTSENLQMGFDNQEEELESAKAEIESCLQVIDALKEKENEYLTLIRNQEKDIERYIEHKEALDKMMKDQENSITDLTDQLQESEKKLKDLEKEKSQFLQLKEDYEEKLAQFDKNCNQLLQEAEVWNIRVQELTADLDKERKVNVDFVETVKVKDEEIESLKQLVETFNSIDEIEDAEEQAKAKEEKLQSLLNNSMILNQLKQEEEKSKLLDEHLEKEKNKILDMEVELLEAKSEIDKLKLNYNQSLQDKAEAQTKLDVLTNYFKDKEIQLQKQLGAQEAVRQKNEEDANSAERRICLIEQENASYKYQVASMKQEMEETERNLKSQIAVQEKKAHENWIAARASERKLEVTQQEVTQLRQRLTLLEREQENWANVPRDEIIRPVPKRMPGVNDEHGSQDLNTSDRGMLPPLPPLPLMLPPDRPLPPLLPPPMPPMFLPPMERHFRSQPWHMPPDHSSDYRCTPPELGRESTPPRGGRQHAIVDGDVGPHASSPLTTDNRDSQNSTPPQLLPDFHDIPPQPGRPFYPPPPPLGHHRLPMHAPFRRDGGPGPKRLDHPNEINSRSSQQAPPQEQWQHSRV